MLEMTTTNLDTVPYDVFYQIASTLDCQDLVHLSRVNRALHDLLRNESIARKIIEVYPSPLFSPLLCHGSLFGFILLQFIFPLPYFLVKFLSFIFIFISHYYRHCYHITFLSILYLLPY